MAPLALSNKLLTPRMKKGANTTKRIFYIIGVRDKGYDNGGAFVVVIAW